VRASAEPIDTSMTNRLTKAHRRWLKRLSTGRIPDAEWPIGFDSRGRLRISEPGEPVPAITVVSEAEARARPSPVAVAVDHLVGGPNANSNPVGK
jgi:hypothetical protein